MRSRDVKLDRTRTRVRVWEMGRTGNPPVVLLHGGGVDHARLSWEPTLHQLAALGFHVIAPDFPGYGESPFPQEPVTLDVLAATVTELLEALRLEKVILGGISLGGGAALAVALSHPEKVERLVLVGAYGLSSFIPGGRLATVWVHLPQPQWLNLALSSSPLLLDLTLRGILKNPAARTPELRGMVAQAMRRSTPAWNDFQRSEMVPGSKGLKTMFAPHLRRLTMPILVVHGLEDFTIPYRDVAQAFADMPNAELHPIPHAGHWTQRDAAAEFHSILARFLFKEVFL